MTKHRTVVVFFFTLLLAGCTSESPPDRDPSGGVEFWTSLDEFPSAVPGPEIAELAKLAQITGTSAGQTIGLAMSSGLIESIDFSFDIDLGVMVRKIDEFYQTPANRRVSPDYVFLLYLMEESGVARGEIRRLKERMLADPDGWIGG